MGDFADDAFDSWIDSGADDDFFDTPCVKPALPTYWKQKDGKITKITDLDDNHLENIIKHLRNHGRENGSAYMAMINEKRRRIDKKRLDHAGSI